MKIEYRITERDYLDFNLYQSKHSKTIVKTNFKSRYITSLGYFIFPLLALITDIPAWYWLIVSVITYGIWILIYPKYFKRRLTKIVLKMLKEDNNSNMLGDKILSVEDDGIFASDASSKSKTNWSGIVDIKETKEHIFIFLSSTSAYIVPIRAFENGQEKDKFLSVVRDKTKHN